MRILTKFRWLFLALFFVALPLSSFAGVFISVGFAPPVLPVYEQPPCPEPGWMWTPGYWAYGPDGYYWVPGQWVPAPYEGALWTPPYWGWDGGFYIFHPGYWGRHVGYYGGVNYGFGYMGVGFVGGIWEGGFFRYNTAIMRVDERRVHNVYIDRTIVQRNTIINDRHIAYSGGPGGINHAPLAQERAAIREQHTAPTSYQVNQERSFRADRNAYATNNGGRPQTPAMARPQGFDNRNASSVPRSQQMTQPQSMQQPNRSTQGLQNAPQNSRPQSNSVNGQQQFSRPNYGGSAGVQQPNRSYQNQNGPGAAQFNNRSTPSNQTAAPQRSMQQPSMQQQQRMTQPQRESQPQRMTQPSAQPQRNAQPQQNRGQEQHEPGGRERR